MTDEEQQRELLGEKVVAAVRFAAAIIEAVWDGKINDPEIAASIQMTASDFGLTQIRQPTAEERADPEWWGHGDVPPALIECYDPSFAVVVDQVADAVMVEADQEAVDA